MIQLILVSTSRLFMRSRFGALLAVFMMLVPSAALGQVRISGKVVDALDQFPLPSATIQVQGTTRGTSTNVGGQFELTISDVPVTLEIRFIGYQTQILEMLEIPSKALRFELKRASLTLEEVVVTGENPAYNIMRQALAAKKRTRQHLKSTYADTYTRFMLYAENQLVQMNESVRSTWWSQTGGTREILRAERFSPAKSGVFKFASPHAVINFQDDDIEIMGTRYAGPLHPNALEMYVFTLGEIREMDGKRVYDIYFTPQSATLPSFSGHVAILDSVFAVLEVNARPFPATNILPPVQLHDIYLEQQFVSIGDSLWLPINLRVQGTVEFGRTGVGYPTARYEQISGQSLHVVNPPVPDSLAVPGAQHIRHPLANRSDELFARNPSFIPLTPKETEVLYNLDSRMTIARAFRPEGLLAQYAAFPVTEQAEEDEEDARPASRFDLGKRIAGGDWFWFNRVDGWHPGLSYGSSKKGELMWRTSVGYSTQRKRISHREQLNVPWSIGPLKGFAGMEFLDATSVIARTEELGRFIPGFATYLGYNDLYDYYNRRAFSANVDFTPSSVPILVSFRGHSEVHGSLEKLSNHEGWLFYNKQRDNPSIHPGDLRSVEIMGRIGEEGENALELFWERSPGQFFDSDWDFTRLEARGTLKFTTFYRRRARPNWFRITALGGFSHGGLPIQRQFTLSGSAGPFSEFTGFRTLKSSRFIADRLAGIFWAHDFTTALFEQLGLWGLAEKGMGVYVFGGHAFSSHVKEIGEFGGRYHEAGLGISYPFGMPFRLEVATGSDREFSFRIGRVLK